MKKERKIKSEKVYLAKGSYPLNDIYYDIFLSSNGKHYFSFVNNQGRTVLLNGNIKGFETQKEAEAMIEQVLKFARQKDRFEIQTAKDGKLFFNLYNDKGEKIAKSFFFRKREDIEASLNEFISGTPSKKKFDSPSTEKSWKYQSNIIPISSNIDKQEVDTPTSNITSSGSTNKTINETEEEKRKRWAENDRIRQEEIRNRQLEKERKAKETEILLAEKKEKREKLKVEKEKERLAAAELRGQHDPMKDRDLFDGCFKWLWVLLLFLLLALLLSYFKGCFGNFKDSAIGTSFNTTVVDSLDNSNQAALNDSLTDDSTSVNSDGDSGNESNSGDNDSEGSNGNGGDIYTNGDIEVANCGCGDKADVFNFPSDDAKSISMLGSNPQFGNSHKLSASDFMEELKYRSQTSSWDRNYLNYLYKAMGYDGFQDARSSHFSQQKLKPGTKGILGFGSYSGYGYYQLDLKGKDLEVFRIEAANGCHVNFMKTCGNLFFTCN